MAMLHSRCRELGLEDKVTFQGSVERGEMPHVFEKHNVLIHPAIYDEPLARVVQEAMAMGLLVVGTTTGGSGELLRHKETGLVFEPEASRGLAAQLVFAANESAIASHIARAGQSEVHKRFNIEQTIEATESYLLKLAKQRGLEPQNFIQ